MIESPVVGLVPYALSEGTRLFDRYDVQARLAEGGVATVYRGWDIRTQTTVALKVFDALRSQDPMARQRFLREFEILSRLDHPQVARAFRFEESDDLCLLVMEFLEGESLRERMDRGPLLWDEVVLLLTKLADALDVLHSAGVVHRDLKPSNVMLHPDRGPIILDFGVAWFSSAMTLTRTGALLGSPKYLAPELLEGGDPDARADIFALGAIGYEALTGRPFRDIEHTAELAVMDEWPAAPKLRALCPELPDVAGHVMERSTATRPEDRFATASEMADAMKTHRSALGRRLEEKLTCEACKTPLIIDLPFCPGCGRAARWALEDGAYAVQILEVTDPEAVRGWLLRRYGDVASSSFWLMRRLQNPPVPLAVGISEATAESLASQAQEAGCRVEVLRGRRWGGPALRAPSATAAEIMSASFMHLTGVFGAGVVLALASAPSWSFGCLPAVWAAVGLPWAYRYTRRPLLRPAEGKGRRTLRPGLKDWQARLQDLQTPRARRLAAAAVARAASVLLEDEAGLPEGAHQDALAALDEALTAAKEVDAHRSVLLQEPRSILRAELRAAEAAQDDTRIKMLTQRHETLSHVAVAHDLAARRALEACRRITQAIETRVTAKDLDPVI